MGCDEGGEGRGGGVGKRWVKELGKGMGWKVLGGVWGYGGAWVDFSKTKIGERGKLCAYRFIGLTNSQHLLRQNICFITSHSYRD